MDKRKLIGILIILTGLILLVGIIYFMFFYGAGTEVAPKEQEEATQPTLPASTTQQHDKPKAVFEAKQPSPVEIKQTDLKQLAASFAERFGSYSNQSDYGNIRDLKIFMSLKMQAWADDFVSKSRIEKGETSIYSGITTKAIAQEARQFDETAGQAEILIKTRRRQDSGTANDAVTYYQDIIIKFVWEKGEWKVDEAVWQ
ncbi:hypothetical protein KAU19_05320 [Candidatus Parcubacteria bacterium]|nr:hypothetical protein [Candidatus Parcubacteria bacterium]